MEAAMVALLTALPGLIAGPASAVVICVLAMVGAGYILVKHVLPRHSRDLEKILEESKETRIIFQEAVTKFGSRLDRIEDDVSDIKDILTHDKRRES